MMGRGKAMMNRTRILSAACILAVAVSRPAAGESGRDAMTIDKKAPALPAKLSGYDPSGLVRFATAAQADERRRELIRWIWPGGLPTRVLPTVTSGIAPAVFSGDLAGLDGSLAASVDRLDADIAPYDFHATMYLVHPRTTNGNSRRLVIINSGHRNKVMFRSTERGGTPLAPSSSPEVERGFCTSTCPGLPFWQARPGAGYERNLRRQCSEFAFSSVSESGYHIPSLRGPAGSPRYVVLGHPEL